MNSLRYLISINADVNCKNFNGATPLIEACRYGNVECVEILIKEKKTVNNDINNNNNDYLNVDIKDIFNMSAIEYSVIMSRTNIIEILLNNCKFSKEVYYKIFETSIYSKKFLCFYKLLEIYDNKNIIDNFTYEEIYLVLMKMLIIHQFDKFMKLMEYLALRKKNDKDNFKFDLEKLENDIDILLISYLSFNIYKDNSQKFKADKENNNKEYTVLTRQFDEDGEKDFDEYEDEIREKIIMNANFNKSKIFNYEQAVNIVKKERDNININNNNNILKINGNCYIDSNNNSNNGNFNNNLLEFEEFIENKLLRFNEKINLILDDILEVNIIKENIIYEIDNNNKTYQEILKEKLYKFTDIDLLITHKYIKLLFKMNKFKEMNIIFLKFGKIFDKFSINYNDIISFIDLDIEKNSRNDFDNCEELKLYKNSNNNDNNNENENNNNNNNENNPLNLIRKLIKEILSNKNSNIYILKELFNYSFSINKRKKNDNYFDKWEKPLYNFNNNNILSLCIKELKNENNYTDTNNNNLFILLIEILNSKIFSIFLFEKIKNKRNILHLIFSLPFLAKKLLTELLNFIKKNFNYEKFYQNLFKMLNEIDYKNLTPIDLTIKKKNYELVEIYTKILNDFLMENYFSKNFALVSNQNTNINNTNSLIFSDFIFRKEEILYKVITINIEVLNETIEIPNDFKGNFLKKKFLFLEESLKKINDIINVYINLNLNLTFSDDNNKRILINEEYHKNNFKDKDEECNLIECKKK
jgi:hypothetical protein